MRSAVTKLSGTLLGAAILVAAGFALADEAPGGSITFELGGLAEDNVELRDGSVLKGDVLSVSMTQVQVRVNGKDQTYDRNQVRKIILVQRESVPQASPAPSATILAPQ